MMRVQRGSWRAAHELFDSNKMARCGEYCQQYHPCRHRVSTVKWAVRKAQFLSSFYADSPDTSPTRPTRPPPPLCSSALNHTVNLNRTSQPARAKEDMQCVVLQALQRFMGGWAGLIGKQGLISIELSTNPAPGFPESPLCALHTLWRIALGGSPTPHGGVLAAAAAVGLVPCPGTGSRFST